MNDFKKRRVKKNLFFTVFVSFRRSLRDYGEEKIAIFKINFGLDQVWIKFVRCLNFTTFGNESTLTFSHGTWRKDIFGENDFRSQRRNFTIWNETKFEMILNHHFLLRSYNSLKYFYVTILYYYYNIINIIIIFIIITNIILYYNNIQFLIILSCVQLYSLHRNRATDRRKQKLGQRG